MQPNNQKERQASPKEHLPSKREHIFHPKYFTVIIVLVVALTAIFFYFLSLDKNDTDNSTHGFVWKKNPNNPGNYIGYYKGIKSTLYLDDCTVTASHGGSSDSMDLDVLAGESQLIAGDMTLDFIDLEPFGEFGSNDIFMVYGGQTGDAIRVVYKPTSGSVPSSSLP